MTLEKATIAELKKLKGIESFTAKISTPIAAQAEQGTLSGSGKSPIGIVTPK